MELDDNKFYKIIFTGTQNFSINELELIKLIHNSNIVRIKNSTKIKYDIENVSKQQTLTGLFAQNILEKMEYATEEEKEKLLKSFEAGMEVLIQ